MALSAFWSDSSVFLFKHLQSEEECRVARQCDCPRLYGNSASVCLDRRRDSWGHSRRITGIATADVTFNEELASAVNSTQGPRKLQSNVTV